MHTIISKIKYIATIALISSCSLLDIKPEHVVSQEETFSDVESYQMALNNVYRNLTSSVMTMQGADYASDDFVNVIPGYASTNYYIYNWDYQSQPQPFIWTYQYQLIANQNVVINNYDLVPTHTEAEEKTKKQIYAQALGLRAWGLFNIAQLYAPRYDGTNGSEPGIPLKLKLELEFLPRAPLSEVYDQIINDLQIAEDLMMETDFNPSSTKKAYIFSVDAVRALRSRVALFIGDYEMAKEASSNFIDIELLDKEDYDMLWSDEFGTENKEIIFMSHDLSDTDDASLVDYHEVFVGNNAVLNQDLLLSFSSGDVRKGAAYIDDSRFPSKYIIEADENNSEADRNLHYKHFRLAEQYLIYAEAVVDANPELAKEILNLLLSKRGADLLVSNPTKEEILKERRKELFSEGLRFYDLKRLSNELNIVVQRNDGKVLAPNSDLYNWDIPLVETNSNPEINK